MIEDAELLRRYAENKSEAAFTELVQRRIDLVYAAALRRVGDAHLAEEITQTVFVTLARKAASLAQHPVLSGWLHRSTQFAAIDALRARHIRELREEEAEIMKDDAAAGSSETIDWQELRPVIDSLLDRLNDADRDAVMLRFFEGRSFSAIGEKLSLTEDAARRRVDRALDKLHALLARRGVKSTAAARGVALANQAAVAAPAGLAASVTGAALAGTTAGTAGWLVTFMTMNKLQIGITATLAVAGASAFGLQAEATAGLRREVAALQAQQPALAALRVENRQLATAAAEVELLRRDDAELTQLAQAATEIKQANAEKTRRAAQQTQAQARSRIEEMANRIRDDDKRAQEEVDRMNREGNKLVEEFKQLSAQAADIALTADARAQADAAAKAKLVEIQNRKKEINEFISNTRQVLNQRLAALRQLDPTGEYSAAPVPSQNVPAGRFELRRTPAEGEGSGASVPPAGLQFTPKP